jgi:benzoyl-CoA-dihydrodiol lyase
LEPIRFETHPDRYQHWKLSIDGPVARLVMDVQEDKPLRPGYVLKLNSYDLGVDIELADAIQRLRFEHPEVASVIVTSAKDKIFCAGANIQMLGMSSHAFKVNFCKYTNETRLSIEDASANSGLHFIAACNGTTAGGGYELALACDEIVLIDDGSSTVGLPEVPLLGVLPGTGGLTRVVDKRKVRRDRADIFCTLSEGMRGKRAVKWNLVDAVVPRSRFEDEVNARAQKAADVADRPVGPGITLNPLEPEVGDDEIHYRHVHCVIDRDNRNARITVHGPETAPPKNGEELHALGDDQWMLRTFRELDDLLVRLRFEEEDCGLFILETRGDADKVLAWDTALGKMDHWLARETMLFVARTLRRLDLTARSLFALVTPGSCFAGTFLELALSADRTYALDDPDQPVALTPGPANGGAYVMSHGLTRLQARCLDNPDRIDEILDGGPYDPEEAEEAGLVTVVADDIDWEDEVRVAIEERCSQSPDALTGMEASLRFPGSENCDSKIFGRLSAWQNWVFQRPNAVGDRGALKLYGRPERPVFEWERT